MADEGQDLTERGTVLVLGVDFERGAVDAERAERAVGGFASGLPEPGGPLTTTRTGSAVTGR